MNVLTPKVDQDVQPKKVESFFEFFEFDRRTFRTKIRFSTVGVIENSVRYFNYIIDLLVTTKVWFFLKMRKIRGRRNSSSS